MPLSETTLDSIYCMIDKLTTKNPKYSTEKVFNMYMDCLTDQKKHNWSSKNNKQSKVRKQRLQKFQERFFDLFPTPPPLKNFNPADSDRALAVQWPFSQQLASGEKIAELRKTKIPKNLINKTVFIYESKTPTKFDFVTDLRSNFPKGGGLIVGKVILRSHIPCIMITKKLPQ